VGDRSKRLKGALCRLVKLVRVGHFADTADHQLGGQVKLGAYIVVDKLLNLKLTKRVLTPGYVTDVVTSGVRGFECALQAISLRFGWLELYLSSQFHALIIACNHYSDKLADAWNNVPASTLGCLLGAFP